MSLSRAALERQLKRSKGLVEVSDLINAIPRSLTVIVIELADRGEPIDQHRRVFIDRELDVDIERYGDRICRRHAIERDRAGPTHASGYGRCSA